MPAIITHHIFGEDVVASLPDGLVDGEEELLAFLLGNQGPDPMFCRWRAPLEVGATVRQLAHDMHEGRVTQAFLAMRMGVGLLPAEDARVGRAFALGFLGHYALDRTAHPFVYAQQRDLALADPSLDACQTELHAIIESDIDSWILWEKRHATVATRPAHENLMCTERITRVAGALLSRVAWVTYGLSVGPLQYGGAVADYAWCYRAIDPAEHPRSRSLAVAERALRGVSYAQAAAHYVRETDECPAANLERHPWADPATGEMCSDSFADRYDQATMYYPGLAEAFVRGDEEGLDELVGGINYNGRPQD